MAPIHNLLTVLSIFLAATRTWFSHAMIETNTNLWWCGSTHTEASTKCVQSCPTGTGCPLGTVCFSGIATCNAGGSEEVNAVGSGSGGGNQYCGRDFNDANSNCNTPCPSGKGCPMGEACFMETTCDRQQGTGSSGVGSGSSGGGSSQTSFSTSQTSASLNGGLTGISAIEQTFLSMKDAINNNLFLYETPMMEWIPSTVYRFEGFFDGLKIMHSQGVAGKKIYLGVDDDGQNEDCEHCYMYGLVNVAAFLAQAMKETIRYDACDENSWDRVGKELMYPISNACGQLGQSYQDYHCSEEERHMECEVDPQMTITAVTNAKWWGAPGPLKCGPKSVYPQTGFWDYLGVCDNVWSSPPETCDEYEGQEGGKAVNDIIYPNAAGRTDVEGCCWWGRGVIQTSGICNFGKLNYFLGKRAADEGRESRYPNIDFCRDPEAICSSQEHQELKWIAGFFYWISDVQPYDNGGWNYINELHKFVDGGMVGEGFINAVSGIVNRGCHNPPCGTGDLDGGPERAQNFFDLLNEMEFSFVEVVPKQPEAQQPAQQPVPVQTPALPEPEIVVPPEPEIEVPGENFISTGAADATGPKEIRYTCGDYEVDPSDTSIPASTDVVFEYELHNEIDVSVFDALIDVKESILHDISRRMGCYITYAGRQLQEDSTVVDDVFANVIGLRSMANDLPNSDVSGCIVDVKTDNPATCTPVSGEFTIYAKPDTSLDEISSALKGIIQTGMGSGLYETASVEKAIYIGERDKFAQDPQPAPITAQTEETSQSNEGIMIVIYALACACLVLLCLLWFTVWTYREKRQKDRRDRDEEMAFNEFMVEEGSHQNSSSQQMNMMAPPQPNNYQSQCRPLPPYRQQGQNPINVSSRTMNDRSHSRRRGSSVEKQGRNPGAAAARISQVATYETEEEDFSQSESSSQAEFCEQDMKMAPTTIPQRQQGPRSHSAPRFQSTSRRMPPQSRMAASDGDSVSSGSSDSSEDSSESDTYNDSERKQPVIQSLPVKPNRPSNNDSNRTSRRSSTGNDGPVGYNQSMDSFQSNSSAREERQKRMAQARARASKRRSANV